VWREMLGVSSERDAALVRLMMAASQMLVHLSERLPAEATVSSPLLSEAGEQYREVLEGLARVREVDDLDEAQRQCLPIVGALGTAQTVSSLRSARREVCPTPLGQCMACTRRVVMCRMVLRMMGVSEFDDESADEQ